VPAIIADRVHGNQAGTAGAIEVFAQSRISALGLVIVVRADEAIENLADGQREEGLVLVEHAMHLIKQIECRSSRCPWSESANSSTNALGAAKDGQRVALGIFERGHHFRARTAPPFATALLKINSKPEQ
jgi:hypothetical protein